jgi:hypothetical protein
VNSSSHLSSSCLVPTLYDTNLTTMEAMCAGIGSPGTLQEILRGYFGDKKAPERFRDDDIVKAGFITIVSQSLVLFIMLSLPYVVFNKLNNDSASSR